MLDSDEEDRVREIVREEIARREDQLKKPQEPPYVWDNKEEK